MTANDDILAQIKRHHSAVAFDAWLRTPEGITCACGLSEGKYLQNRLWYAFMAGYSARTSEGEPK